MLSRMRQAAPRWCKEKLLRARGCQAVQCTYFSTVSSDKSSGLLGLDMYHQPSDFMARATGVVDKCQVLRDKVRLLCFDSPVVA